MTEQPQQHGVGGVDLLQSWIDEDQRRSRVALLTEVERLQAQVAQLTEEREEFKRLARFSQKDEEAMAIIHRAADLLRDDHGLVEELAHLRARCASLEAAAKKAVSSLGDPYYERAIELLGVVLDQHATTTQEGTHG